MKIILPQQKRFIVTKAGPGAFLPLLPVGIAPDALLRVLFNRPLERASDRGAEKWFCKSDESPSRANQWACQTSEGLNVARLADENGARRFQMSNPRAEISLVLTEAKAKVEAGNGLFDLAAPAGYQQEIATPQ